MPTRRAAWARPRPPSTWPPRSRSPSAGPPRRRRPPGQPDQRCRHAGPGRRRPVHLPRAHVGRRRRRPCAVRPPDGHRRASTSSPPTATSPAPRSRWSACSRASSASAACSDPLADRYDYIFIDCPPSLGLLTLNALVAADSVLIPLHCEYFALEGLAELVATMRRVRAALNPALDIEGVLLTMYDERTNLGQQVARDVRAVLQGEDVFDTVIPRNVRLGEAPSHGMPVVALRREVARRRGVPRARPRVPRPRRAGRNRRAATREIRAIVKSSKVSNSRIET